MTITDAQVLAKALELWAVTVHATTWDDASPGERIPYYDIARHVLENYDPKPEDTPSPVFSPFKVVVFESVPDGELWLVDPKAGKSVKVVNLDVARHQYE